jgi:V8-like Glu-specific endopeptidase
MPASRGGDSGAPVWMLRDDGHAQVVGIWPGGRTTRSGGDYGRFASLASAMDTLGVGALDIN